MHSRCSGRADGRAAVHVKTTGTKTTRCVQCTRTSACAYEVKCIRLREKHGGRKKILIRCRNTEYLMRLSWDFCRTRVPTVFWATHGFHKYQFTIFTAQQQQPYNADWGGGGKSFWDLKTQRMLWVNRFCDFCVHHWPVGGARQLLY